eukprot:COSAG01_NODE_5591_length_4159_cov_59.059852_2_plen_122_part_00
MRDDQTRVDDSFTGLLLRLHPEVPEGVPQAERADGGLRASLVFFLFVRAQRLWGGGCGLDDPLPAPHMSALPEGACAGTQIGEECTAFSCLAGYTGGAITCQAFGSYQVTVRSHRPHPPKL